MKTMFLSISVLAIVSVASATPHPVAEPQAGDLSSFIYGFDRREDTDYYRHRRPYPGFNSHRGGARDRDNNGMNSQNKVMRQIVINIFNDDNKPRLENSESNEQNVQEYNKADDQPIATVQKRVTPNTSRGDRFIDDGGNGINNGVVGRWVWLDSDNIQQANTDTYNTAVVEDRGAFTIDQCPTGKVRFGNKCVDEV